MNRAEEVPIVVLSDTVTCFRCLKLLQVDATQEELSFVPRLIEEHNSIMCTKIVFIVLGALLICV